MEAPELNDDPVLAEIVRRLVEAYRPERIYLFGSKARGDAGPDSDYDLMVVVPSAESSAWQQSLRTAAALRGMGIATDVLVWSRDAFEKRLHLKVSLPATVLREGKLVYDA
jgi:predicted nucleotidyltransferase